MSKLSSVDLPSLPPSFPPHLCLSLSLNPLVSLSHSRTITALVFSPLTSQPFCFTPCVSGFTTAILCTHDLCLCVCVCTCDERKRERENKRAGHGPRKHTDRRSTWWCKFVQCISAQFVLCCLCVCLFVCIILPAKRRALFSASCCRI